MTYAVPHVSILGVVPRRVISTILVPIDITTSGEPHSVADTEITDYVSAHPRIAELTSWYDLGTFHLNNERTIVSPSYCLCTYCSGSIYTSAVRSARCNTPSGTQELTLIVDTDFAAYHEFGWILPIKRLPMVFVLISKDLVSLGLAFPPCSPAYRIQL